MGSLVLSQENLEEIKTAILATVKPWLNVKEAAVYLGISISKVYKLAEADKIVQHFIDGKMVFSRHDLDKVPQKKRSARLEEEDLDNFAKRLRRQRREL